MFTTIAIIAAFLIGCVCGRFPDQVKAVAVWLWEKIVALLHKWRSP